MGKLLWSLAMASASAWLVAAGSSAQSAIFDSFLKLPGVQGESIAQGNQTIEITTFQFGAAAPVPGQPNPQPLPQHVVLADPGVPQLSSFFDVFVDVPPQNFPAQSFFDIFVDVQLPDGTSTPPVQIPPAQNFPASSFFDIFVDVQLPGLGFNELHYHGQASQPGVTFMPPTASPQGPGSFFDIFTELDVNQQSNPSFNPALPLYRVTMTSQSNIVPEPSSAALCGVGLAALFVMAKRRRAAAYERRTLKGSGDRESP
jgi:hypothetical protein